MVLNQTIEYSGPIELMDDDWETVDIVEVQDELVRFDDIEYASHGAGPAVFPYWICARLETDEQCIIWPSDIPEWYFTPDKPYPNIEGIKQTLKEDMWELEDRMWHLLGET